MDEERYCPRCGCWMFPYDYGDRVVWTCLRCGYHVIKVRVWAGGAEEGHGG